MNVIYFFIYCFLVIKLYAFYLEYEAKLFAWTMAIMLTVVMIGLMIK